MTDDDGRPVGDHRAGDVLPGGVRAGHRLGVGFRCETWLAWSDALWQPAVVKFPRPDQLDHPRAREALGREVAALAANLHPALPRLYVDGTAEPTPFVLVEHVDGPDLDDELEDRGALSDIEVATLGVALLAAARVVHRRGLAHVDVKPANVLLRDGRPVLVDFGSARRLGARQPAGRLIGSPGYAAPDLEAGAPIATAMDVYGLGVTLWEACTGEIAFDPELHAADRPTLAPAGDSRLGELVARMTAPVAAERPTVEEALVELGAVADPDGGSVWPAWARAPLTAAS